MFKIIKKCIGRKQNTLKTNEKSILNGHRFFQDDFGPNWNIISEELSCKNSYIF